MARQEKSTRARGLPPRVLLSQRQDATGSFPTVWRTSSDNRTGRYNISFNDNKVVPFNQYEAADYDSNFLIKAASDVAAGVQYVEKVEDVGFVAAGGSRTVFFSTPFTDKPIVVISELSSANSLQNVNAFLAVAVNQNEFTVKFSSEFQGSIVYRAVYEPAPETLRVVERKPRYPNAFTRFTATSVALINNSSVDITFNDFGDDTAENFVTFYDPPPGNGQADIWPNITTQTRTLVALTASSIATAAVEYQRFHGLHNRGIIYPVGMNQATILAGLSQENQIEMYGSVSFISGAVVNQPTKWIVASGSMKKNVADTFVTFTPGQDIQAFRDSDNPAVDGKGSGNPFYATGSAVTVTGQGFQQPLWSKSKVEIDLTPASSQTISLNNTGSTGNYPMSYWNPNTKQYEGIGTGRGLWSGFGNTAPSDIAAIQELLENQMYGFGASIDTGDPVYGITPEKTNVYGRQISTFGFPYHIKFQPTSSQQIEMNKYVSEPFLLEKIVLELSGTLQTEHPLYGTDSAIWTFFVLNSRNFVPNKLSDPKTINIKVAGGPRSSFATSSFVGSSYLDLLDYFQVAYTGSFSTDNIDAINRELIVTPTELSTPLRYIYNNQMAISSSVKSSLKYDGSGFYATINSANTTLLASQSLNISGRNQLFNANARDWKTTFESNILSGITMSSQPLTLDSIEVNVFYTKPNPYILLPTDKITLGFQLPWSATMGFANYGVTSSIGFATSGINKITLYGSSLRVNPETNQLEEHHDTLNQLLSSESIHEVITG